MPQPLSSSTAHPRNQSHIDDAPNKCEAPPPAAKASAKPSGPFIGGYTGRDGSTGVSREAVNQLSSQATKPRALPPKASPPPPPAAPAPAPKAGRSPAECADKAANFVIPCAASLAAVPAASPTLVGSFVAGAAAGLLCANAYYEYADCVEGRK